MANTSENVLNTTAEFFVQPDNTQLSGITVKNIGSLVTWQQNNSLINLNIDTARELATWLADAKPDPTIDHATIGTTALNYIQRSDFLRIHRPPIERRLRKLSDQTPEAQFSRRLSIVTDMTEQGWSQKGGPTTLLEVERRVIEANAEEAEELIRLIEQSSDIKLEEARLHELRETPGVYDLSQALRRADPNQQFPSFAKIRGKMETTIPEDSPKFVLATYEDSQLLARNILASANTSFFGTVG